ncbi:hypothetical protein ASG60_20730 [Methylobacterium sp. Leaf469]|uniref:hypothetical protein n=1 Tax=Methylobacterium sp. Leaf469 TaxID=1736387 RepID=UPI0006F8E6C9|nr:hypothetical protein [Methylobacterium sp. Leaf469]KQT96062.1 hypothetical protein ASG60_20730 [Methylobacterium sp. Leaf469]
MTGRGNMPLMKSPLPASAAEDAATARQGRLHVRVPPNLALAVRLAAEVRRVPVSSFVADALHDRLARDAAPSKTRADR